MNIDENQILNLFLSIQMSFISRSTYDEINKYILMFADEYEMLNLIHNSKVRDDYIEDICTMINSYKHEHNIETNNNFIIFYKLFVANSEKLPSCK